MSSQLEPNESERRGLSNSEIRSLLGGVTAFFLPGAILGVLFSVTSSGSTYSDGHPYELWELIIIIPAMSAAGALFGSPVIIIYLILWRILHKKNMTQWYVLTALGLTAGCVEAAIFATIHIDILVIGCFVLAGLLTGLAIWRIAYPMNTPDQSLQRSERGH